MNSFLFSPNFHLLDKRWESCEALAELSLARIHKELQERDIFWGCMADTAEDGGEALLEYSLVLADDGEIQRFNNEFRDKDKPTNVLSFPADEPGELGDLILSYDTIVREAEEQGKSLDAHVTHMIIHGILHLLGFDHEESEEEAEEMEALEIDLLNALGVSNPY